VKTTTLEKTVAIPDGSTVLIGGLKKVCETRNEFGPPILTNILFLNRLFENVSCGREERVVLVLVTPRIIVDEKEKTIPAKCDTRREPWSDGEEQETSAKPEKLSRQEKVVRDLLKAYDEACAEGRKAEAKKFARAALAIDPTCFRNRR